MIGIDRATGQTLTGFEQLVSRITQVLTTPIGGRVKRPKFGSDVRKYLAANLSDHVIAQVQAAAIAAFYNPENGITDFKPTRCIVQRHSDGMSLYFEGTWQGRMASFEVPLSNAST